MHEGRIWLTELVISLTEKSIDRGNGLIEVKLTNSGQQDWLIEWLAGWLTDWLTKDARITIPLNQQFL